MKKCDCLFFNGGKFNGNKFMSFTNQELLLSTNDLKTDSLNGKMLYCIQLSIDGLRTRKERVRLRQFKESANFVTLAGNGKDINGSQLARQAGQYGLKSNFISKSESR